LTLANGWETSHHAMSFLFRSAHKPGTTYKTQTGCPDSIHLRQHHIYGFGLPQCPVRKTPLDEIRGSCWELIWICFDPDWAERGSEAGTTATSRKPSHH